MKKVNPVCGKPELLMKTHLKACPFVDRGFRDTILAQMNAGITSGEAIQPDENFFASRNCFDAQQTSYPSPATPRSFQIMHHNPQYYYTTPSPTPFISHNSVNLPPPSKCLRTSYSTGSIYGSGVDGEPPSPIPVVPPPMLSLEKQNEFNHDMCRLFVAMGIAFHGVKHPELHQFMSKWVPGSILPSNRALSGSLLESEASKAIEQTKLITFGQLANYQCDGWKNVAKTAIVTSMIVVNYQVISESIQIFQRKFINPIPIAILTPNP